MSEKFHAEVHVVTGAADAAPNSLLKVSGVLDEDNDLSTLAAGTEKLEVAVIDAQGIERINSCGVRDWVNWLEHLSSLSTQVALVGCSPAIVQQINLVHNFTARGWVKSFYAPYFCPRCDVEKLLLVETSDMIEVDGRFRAPSCRCDECDGPMDFDDLEDSYFTFLGGAGAKKIDVNVELAVNDLVNAAANRKPEISSSSSSGSAPSGLGIAHSSSSGSGRSSPSSPSGSGRSVSDLPSVPSLSASGSNRSQPTELDEESAPLVAIPLPPRGTALRWGLAVGFLLLAAAVAAALLR